MDLDWMTSFLALIEHRSFTEAASAQRVSQPAFSRRIRNLERWVGTELVDRSTHPLTLTTAGMILREQANVVVASLSAVRDEVRSRQLTPRRAVRIAAGHSVAAHYFAQWWRLLTAQDPSLTCVLLPSNTLEAYDALLHGSCDLLLAYADPTRPLGVEGDLEWMVVATDRLAPYSRLRAGRPDFSLPGTAQQPVPCVSHGPGAFLGRITDRLLSADPLHLRPVVQSDLTSALAMLACAGTGVAWLPDIVAGPHVERGELGDIGNGRCSADLEIRLYRSRKPMSGPAAAVWQCARP